MILLGIIYIYKLKTAIKKFTEITTKNANILLLMKLIILNIRSVTEYHYLI